MGLQRQIGRATGILTTGALCATLLIGSSPRTWADDDGSLGRGTKTLQNATVDLELAEAPLTSAIQLVQKRTGASIVFHNDPGYRFGTVNVKLTGQPISKVLEMIAQSAGADFWVDEGIYHIGPKGSAPRPQEPILPPPVRVDDTPQVNTAPWRYEKIHINYVDAQTILNQLGVTQPGYVDFAEQMRRNSLKMLLNSGTLGDVRGMVNDTVNLTGDTRTRNAARSAPTDNIGNALGNPGAGVDQTAHRDDGNDDETTFGRGGQFGFGAGQPPGTGGGGQPGGLGQPGQPGGQAGGPGQAQGLLPPGVNPGDIYALPNDNSIIVRFQDEQALRQLREIIRLLDVKPRQIMIKAEFITVSQQDANTFGINWQFQKVNLVGSLNAGFAPQGQAILQYATGNFQTQLNFVLTTGRGKVVSSPMATTLNNVQAQFVSTTAIPIFIQNVVGAAGGQTLLQTIPVYLPITSGLVVTPRINGDDSVSLTGVLLFQDQQGTVTGPNGETLPITIGQQLPVARIVRNGDTMVLGGLVRKRDSNNTAKVPLLGDLPLIGSLFRSHTVSTDDSELLIFITPTILPDRVSNAPIGGGAGLGPAPLPGPGAGGNVNPGGQ